MRISLEELRAMSDEQLHDLWADAKFPFDRTPCRNCLTLHLEELYALRLFYDSLYPQPTDQPEAPAEEPALTALALRKERVND